MTEYPSQLYAECANIDSASGRIEHAYDLGRKHATNDPLDGWNNLTQAIKDDENIDWEKLDGMAAKCVHPDRGTLTYKLERDKEVEVDRPYGWYTTSYWWSIILVASWGGDDGWSLWVKGAIPLKRKTADQLPLGMCFKGKSPEYVNPIHAVVFENSYGYKYILIDEFEATPVMAENIEVLEEYGIGTFKAGS